MVSTGWGVGRRVGFRFGILFGALLAFPFPIGTIPRTEGLRDLLNAPLDAAVRWFAQSVLGLAAPSNIATGSSDTTWHYLQLLVIAILAALGTIVWSAVDRRRTAYPRLAAGAATVLRYYLVSVMLFYGVGKILKLQFPDLTPGWLDRRVGEMSPMGFLWTFMGYSRPYTVFAGLAETLGAVLLLWRRTATLGALVVVAVMTNVVVLDFCYDVAAKLYSLQILIIAGLIALPGARRLMAAAMGRAVPEVPPRARMSPPWERARRIGKIAMLSTLAGNLYLGFRGEVHRDTPVHELYGTWIVDSFVADGVEHPPLTTDPERWRAISANPTRLWISAMTGAREGGSLQVDAAHRTITLERSDLERESTSTTETWSYTRLGSEHLVIDGAHRGRQLHVALHLEPPSLLVTRGFHWITEFPLVQ
jgi:uncharacterized membrane protein YphA (DoxX/SURF4 family)